MRKLTGILILILASSSGLSAGPLNYIKHHKQLLTRDALVVGVYLAAAATEPCYRPTPCSDHSPFFPPHPTHAQVYLPAMAIAAGLVTINHVAYHYDQEPNHLTANVIGWMWTAPVVTNEAFDVKGSLDWKVKK